MTEKEWVSEEKKKIRSEIKKKRRELEPGQKKELDRAVLENLLRLPEFRENARPFVCCYVSIGGEVDTLKLMETLWLCKIPVAVPRVEGPFIRFYQINGPEDLAPGCMGIPEPTENCRPVQRDASVVITPGLAFTPEGKRIGYGGGFYDKFFEEEPEHIRIAVAYPFQVLPALPAEECDRRVQILVTSNRIYRCGTMQERNGNIGQEDGLWN